MPAIGIAQDFKSDLEITDTSDIFWEQLYFPDTADIKCISTNEAGDIFIGTGGNENDGLYRSTDFGETWDFVLNCNNHGIISIDINPQGDIFIGKLGFDNFQASYDNGDTWTILNRPPYTTGNITKIHCQGNDTIYIGTWEDGGGLLSRSTDGGYSWDSLFLSQVNPGDHITDIVISSGGDIYLSIMGYFNNTGGVYRSVDNGNTWEFLGLMNHQVGAMAINSNNEIFTGDWYTMLDEVPGIYALYNESDTLQIIRATNGVTDMAINSDGHIFVLNGLGILRSMDNGESFEYVNEGITSSFFDIHIDNEGFAYISRYNELYRSVNTTVAINEQVPPGHFFNVYPNPFSDNINIRGQKTDRLIKSVTIFNISLLFSNSISRK
ncbi:MAG: exo-alpha-sialidase [Chlorobi bacterium]|nr:exo-alpha-sialidase [Chlorobiota bacterium]